MRTRTLARTLLLLLSFLAASPLRSRIPTRFSTIRLSLRRLRQARKTPDSLSRRHALPRLRRQNRHLHPQMQISESLLPGTPGRRRVRHPRLHGKSAWHLSAPGEAATLLGSDALQIEAVASFTAGHLLNLKKNKVASLMSAARKSPAPIRRTTPITKQPDRTNHS